MDAPEDRSDFWRCASSTAGTSPPRSREIWFTDMDAGFFVTKFANGVWPFRP
jgi:hypothetical protein